MIASLAMGTLSKDTNTGKNIGGSMGDMPGGLMGNGKGGIDVDDVLNLANKFF